MKQLNKCERWCGRKGWDRVLKKINQANKIVIIFNWISLLFIYCIFDSMCVFLWKKNCLCFINQIKLRHIMILFVKCVILTILLYFVCLLCLNKTKLSHFREEIYSISIKMKLEPVSHLTCVCVYVYKCVCNTRKN